MGSVTVTIRLNDAEWASVVRVADGSVGVFVKRVALEAAVVVPAREGGGGARGKVSAGGSVRVRGGRPPSPAADPAVRGVVSGPPLEGGVVFEPLGVVVARVVGSQSLGLRALRLGQVRVDGCVVRDSARPVVAAGVRVSVAVSDAG